jgi:ligand-binding SRPBCC domain-containing protein
MEIEIITPGSIDMAPGAIIDYAVRVFGIRCRWTTLIAVYDPPYRFVDVQIKGPYSFWHHTHTFEAIPDGTVIKDEIRYILPLSILGRIAHGIVVKRQLNHIFDYRSRRIADILTEITEKSENVQEGLK